MASKSRKRTTPKRKKTKHAKDEEEWRCSACGEWLGALFKGGECWCMGCGAPQVDTDAPWLTLEE